MAKGGSIGDGGTIAPKHSTQINTAPGQGCTNWSGMSGGKENPGGTKPMRAPGSTSKPLSAGRGK